MTDVFKLIRESFINELNEESDFWRIMRKETFIDLIKLGLIKYQKTNNTNDLVDIINLSLKIKILSHPQLKEITVRDNPEEVYKQFNKEKELIIKLYDEVFQKATIKLNNYSNKEISELHDEVQYLKMINQLEIKEYSDEIFDDLICISMNLLSEKT